MFRNQTALFASALLLAACHRQAEPSRTVASPPTPEATAPRPTPTPAVSTPTISLAPGSATVTVTPAPTPCGAEKLSDYVNLLPTSTARQEITRTLGHRNVRYVPLKPPPIASQPKRVTAQMGVDGRIKKFTCG